ncbi:hypothetical protein BC831DRAFT_451967 [Entophlyctis helioformis]|nr:hypothetical protein BC831DRAFT_451967 [Entophlyctis helioformis]
MDANGVPVKAAPSAQVPGHFGDIMSSRETTTVLDGGFSPLERIVLTANGNLQRILSAYFNSKVTVDLVRNNQVDSADYPDALVFDREVDIMCLNKVCCNAKSTVIISRPEYARLVTVDKVGIGQLFRYLNILPEFRLINVFRTEQGLLRDYSLECDGVRCIIREEFPNNLFAADFFAHRSGRHPDEINNLRVDAVNAISGYQPL